MLSATWERNPESVVGWDGVQTLLSAKALALEINWEGLLTRVLLNQLSVSVHVKQISRSDCGPCI